MDQRRDAAFADGETETGREKEARSSRAAPSKAERAAANAYWRLWRRNWRPPFRREDAPNGDALMEFDRG